MSNNALGSLWSKWDLHFHTPSSFDYENEAVSNRDIIESLLNSDIKVVAITDHHYIDVERINKLREISGDRLTILPGIELRSELGDKPIHYIALFSESAGLENIWDTIRGTLGLTPQGIKEKGGDETIYVPILESYKVIRKLGGLLSIHAGGKSNSIEGIRNTEQFQRRIKFNITHEYIDIFEIGQIKDITRYRNIVFPNIGFERPLIICSDNHNAFEYSIPEACWFKSDPTFTGLRQVLNEPNDRIYLGDRPELLEYIEKNKTRYIQSISVQKRRNSTLEEKWFCDVSINFNTGLTAIIGNKGCGKSALTDIIGLLGNCPHEDSFSFLHKDQFRHPRGDKAKWFDATLTWRSGLTITKNLNDKIQSGFLESVRYIPQLHLDAICDELKGGRDGLFNKELKQVIFSRVSDSDQLGKSSLDELIEFLTRESKDCIRQIVDELVKVTDNVVKLEEQATDAYKIKLLDGKKVVEEEIKAHMAIQPPILQKPDTDPDKKREIEEITKLIEDQVESIEHLDKLISRKKEEHKTLVFKLQILEKIRKKLNNLQNQIVMAKTEIEKDLGELNIKINDVFEFRINTEKIEEKDRELTEQKRGLENELNENNATGPVVTRNRTKESVVSLREKLDRPNKEYQEYLEKKANWERKHASLIGNSETINTLKYYEKKLTELTDVPTKLEDARKKQIDCSLRIFREKQKLLSIYAQLYTPVQEFIDSHPIEKEKFGLEFQVSLKPSKFIDSFLEFINQKRRGSFYGEAEGRRTLEQILSAVDFNTENEIREFVQKITDYLTHDKRSEDNCPLLVSEQVRQSFTPSSLYEFIFSLGYLEPRYFLRYDGRPLEQLSPGERGTLLLIFYLLIDDSKMPLIIDQPEGNLDNQTVFQILVGCIKEAKKKRQIIIVTHNPNLAVVCDAEQVIIATLNKEQNYQLQYQSGALENPYICGKIVDVLEGTKPAIDNRVAKYRIIFNEETS